MVIDHNDNPELSDIMELLAAHGLGLADMPDLLADRAAVDPAFRARLEVGAELARRWLAEVEAYGLVRAVQGADGRVTIEMLDWRLH